VTAIRPEVSVVVLLYNKEHEVLRAMRSILSQTVRNLELIVVDDGSTDGSPAVANGLDDPRIRIFRQSNAGVSAARNRGIREARADVIAFIDADDEWEPRFLETVLRLRRLHVDARIYGTRYFFRTPAGFTRKAVIRGIGSGFSEGLLSDYFRVACQSDPPLCASATAVDASAIREIGGFPTGVRTGEDLLTWARLAARFRIAYSMEPLSNFWKQDISGSSRPGRRPQTPDSVGDELQRLDVHCGHATKGGLREYLGLWYRMRGSVYLQWGESTRARSELMKARRLCRPSLSLSVLFLISMLPNRMASVCYWTLSRWQRALRWRA
jgi:cellulose synthase/poly-beta-1,6-N-acetylglucosamine synthase-like glycosyltransferase